MANRVIIHSLVLILRNVMLAFIASGHICWHENFSIFYNPQCEILLFLRCPYGRTIAWYKVLHKCILYHSSIHFYSRWSLDATITVPALWYMYAVRVSGSQSTRRMASFITLHLSNYLVYNSNAITNAVQIYTVLQSVQQQCTYTGMGRAKERGDKANKQSHNISLYLLSTTES